MKDFISIILLAFVLILTACESSRTEYEQDLIICISERRAEHKEMYLQLTEKGRETFNETSQTICENEMEK